MSNELLIACAVKGTFILIAAGVLSMALRRASAAARHLVWTVAFAALLLLPVLSLAVPRWTVAAPAIRRATRGSCSGCHGKQSRACGIRLDIPDLGDRRNPGAGPIRRRERSYPAHRPARAAYVDRGREQLC